VTIANAINAPVVLDQPLAFDRFDAFEVHGANGLDQIVDSLPDVGLVDNLS